MRMRIRSVKPGFFQHGDLFDLEESTGLPLRIVFEGLWCASDRKGVFEWKPRELKLNIIPHDQCSMEDCLEALRKKGFIKTFRHGGKPWGFVPTLQDHQYFNPQEKPEALYPDPRLARMDEPAGPRIDEPAAPLPPAPPEPERPPEAQETPKPAAPRKRAPKPPTPKQAASWTYQACKAWEDRFGHVAHGGKITRFLKPLIDKFGEEEVLAVWRKYLEEKDAEFANPADFAEKYAVWKNGAPTTRKRAGATQYQYSTTGSTALPKEKTE